MSRNYFFKKLSQSFSRCGDFPFVEIAIFTFPQSRYHLNSNRHSGVSAMHMRYRSLHNSKILFTSRSSACSNHMPFLSFFLEFFHCQFYRIMLIN
jgi:hypothetical protein